MSALCLEIALSYASTEGTFSRVTGGRGMSEVTVLEEQPGDLHCYYLAVVMATDGFTLATRVGPRAPLNVDGQDSALLPALPVPTKSITS